MRNVTRLARRMTTRQTYNEAQMASAKLMDLGYLVRTFAMTDPAGNFYLLLYERDECPECFTVPCVCPEEE